MAFTLVTVTGMWETPEGGEAASGTVTATLRRTMRNGTTQITPRPVLGKLDGEGRLVTQDGGPFRLPATDDSGTTPVGVAYEWTVELDNAPLQHFFAPLAHATSPVDITTLEPSQ
jgi:hypothetical protein